MAYEDYIITDGERRWRAYKLAHLQNIPCKVFKIGNNLQQRRIMQLMNDIQKEEIPTAERYQALWELYEIEYPTESKKFLAGANHTSNQNNSFMIREFAHSIGKDHSYIVRAFDYLELAKEEPEIVKFSNSPFSLNNLIELYSHEENSFK